MAVPRLRAPNFKTRTPRDPLTGKLETLQPQGISPYVALMQVASEDTHDNYVVCQGFDTRDNKYYYYEEGDADKRGIAVAKPYGLRGQTTYTIGEMYIAVLPLTVLKQNPLVAATTVGHPADLDEELELLYDDEGVAINWMFAAESTAAKRPKCHFTLDEELTTAMETVEGTIETQYGNGTDHDVGVTITLYNLPTHEEGVYEFFGDAGDWGIASYAADPGDTVAWMIDIVECP